MQPPDGLWGPFSLTPKGIDSAVTTTLPGVYTLGKVNQHGEGEFQVRFVGRDDHDVRASLKKHIADWYPYFFYKYFFSAQQAFEKECELYHNCNPPDNKGHPVRPEGSSWTCPRCKVFS